jgi:REP element-mobilizing transposase RayT
MKHYHLLVETLRVHAVARDEGSQRDVAERFNWRHDRVGHLFQGRFGSEPVDTESHLREIFRYLVLNPVRAGIVEYASDYEWSNYRATAGLAQRPEWLEVD